MCLLLARALATFLPGWAGSGLEGQGLWGVVCVRRLLVKLWLEPVGMIYGLGGFGGLGGFHGCGHGLGAGKRGGCPLACALLSSGSQFARTLPGGVQRVVQWPFWARWCIPIRSLLGLCWAESSGPVGSRAARPASEDAVAGQ